MMATNQPAKINATRRAPAQPTYILRGHSSSVHGVHFLRQNTRLLTGDADGFVVLWDIAIKRATVVWRAHEGAILGLGTWGEAGIVTHGRDSSLRVWSLTCEDETHGGFSKDPPVELQVGERKQPWLLHALTVSTLNFCGFASCTARSRLSSEGQKAIERSDDTTRQDLLIAVPAARDDHVSIYHLPSEKLVGLIPAPRPAKTKAGMVMALKMLHQPGTVPDASSNPSRQAQDTLTVIAGYESGRASVFIRAPSKNAWQEIYTSTPHSQPILSLDAAVAMGCFFTSAADAVVAKHPLFSPPSDEETVDPSADPIKVSQTRHSGQQSLVVRVDERIFATAGWDGRVRVYSGKTLKEVACCKWHREGCYSVAFARVGSGALAEGSEGEGGMQQLVTRMQTVAQVREERTRQTHWMAAGSKDGKVSLWDIF